MKHTVTFYPSGQSAMVRQSATILEAARAAKVSIRTRCGGKAACFMCKVMVRPGSVLLPMGDQERRKLAGLEDESFRLSCQARIGGEVHVEVPLDPLRAAVMKQLARQNEEDKL